MMSTKRSVFLLAFAFAVLLSVPFADLATPVSHASAYSGVSVEVDSPIFAGTSEAVLVTIIVIGGPAADEGGNFSYKDVVMTGDNTTGWRVDHLSQASESGVFKFNLTMPATPDQTVKVTLTAVSTEWRTSKEESANATFEIKVVDPIIITAEVFNNGVVDAVNATARIYADGVLLDTQVINVTAGSSKVIQHNWTFLSIREGKHVITVTVDDPNGLVEFSDGNNEYALTIYVGDQGNPIGAVLTVLLLVVIVFFVLTYMQKPAKRGKKV